MLARSGDYRLVEAFQKIASGRIGASKARIYGGMLAIVKVGMQLQFVVSPYVNVSLQRK